MMPALWWKLEHIPKIYLWEVCAEMVGEDPVR